MISAQHMSDQVSKAYGFKLEIKGLSDPGSTEGGWRSIQGGGLRIHEGRGCTFGPDKFSNTTRGIAEWEPLTLVGAVTGKRKDCITWFKEMVNGDDPFKDISITLLGTDGGDLYTINYLECFMMSYTLGALNADEENEELRETVEISVGYSDNLLNA